MPSVKRNFGYNLVLTLCGYLFPLITYPYVSRVLGVGNIGICNFVDSIINYFVIFSMLGINSYGVREIARIRNDKDRRDNVFSNLILINFITTVFAIVLLITCTFSLPRLSSYKPFLLIGICKLFFSIFLVEWFFQGIQDFKYITIRSLIVRVFYLVSIFVFVRDSEDVLVYYSLTIFVTVVNAIINWIHVNHYVHLNFKNLNIRYFLIPVIVFGYYKILSSMYTYFNTVFLGFVCGDIEVGYFATATKIYSIIMSVLTAFTVVMVPKVSELLKEGRFDKLQWIANQTLSIILTVSLPIIYFCQYNANEIILIIAGSGYEGAVIPFRIIILLLIIIGPEQILIQQFLMASTKNKPILFVSTIGAITGVSFNIMLTPLLSSLGSAISWGVSEISVLIAGTILVKRNLHILIPFQDLFKVIIWSILYIIPLYAISCLHLGMLQNLFFSIISTAIVFVIINLWLHKNYHIVELCGMLSKKVKKNHISSYN